MATKHMIVAMGLVFAVSSGAYAETPAPARVDCAAASAGSLGQPTIGDSGQARPSAGEGGIARQTAGEGGIARQTAGEGGIARQTAGEGGIARQVAGSCM